MSSITIRYPTGSTNIKEENISNLTYLTLSNIYPNQIEIMRPIISTIQTPIQTPMRITPIQTPVRITPIQTPVRITQNIRTSPEYIPSPRLTQSSQGTINFPSPILSPRYENIPTVFNSSVRVSEPRYENLPTVFNPSVRVSEPNSCIGQENTLIIKIKGIVNIDDLIKNIEAYIDVKCTEVRNGMGNKLLIIHFNDRSSVDIAYEVITSVYQGSIDMEVYK